MILVLSFLAGMLTTLSPCVLPVLPIIIAGALQESYWGPLVLALGLASSFALLALFLASVGESLGIEQSHLRILGAVAMAIGGLAWVSPRIESLLGVVFQPLANRVSGLSVQKKTQTSLMGTFVLGASLGAVWSPCSGPTLGIAMGLIAQSGSRWIGVARLLSFGLGATAPLLVIAYLSRGLMRSHRERMRPWIESGKRILGALLLTSSVLIIFGFDKNFENWVLERVPENYMIWISKY